MEAILGPCKIEKVNTQFCPRIWVLSLYTITKSVPDPYIQNILIGKCMKCHHMLVFFQKVFFLVHLCHCTVGSYASLSVHVSVTRKKFITLKLLHLLAWNLVSTWTWMTPKLTLRVKVIGQGHEVKKRYFMSHSTTLQVFFEVKGHMGQGQRSHWSRSKVDLEGQGQRSRSSG